MKKTLQFLVALLITANVFAQPAAVGTTFDDGTFQYTITDISTDPLKADVSGILTPTANVVIPASATFSGFQDYECTVTAVDTLAFGGDGTVESIVLPSTITTLRHRSFFEAPELTSVTTAGSSNSASINLENVVIMENNIFTRSGVKGDVNLPVCTTIQNYCFNGTTGITSINIPVVETIGNGGVYDFGEIREIDVPNTLISADGLFLGRLHELEQVQVNWSSAELASVNINSTNFFRGADFSAITLYVPAGTTADYDAHALWGQFTDIQEGEMPELLSVSEVEQELGFSIYPNPTNGLVSLKSNNALSADVTVYDINGRALLNQNMSSNVTKVNISHLASGLYIFRVQTESGEFSKRILKQ